MLDCFHHPAPDEQPPSPHWKNVVVEIVVTSVPTDESIAVLADLLAWSGVTDVRIYLKLEWTHQSAWHLKSLGSMNAKIRALVHIYAWGFRSFELIYRALWHDPMGVTQVCLTSWSSTDFVKYRKPMGCTLMVSMWKDATCEGCLEIDTLILGAPGTWFPGVTVPGWVESDLHPRTRLIMRNVSGRPTVCQALVKEFNF
jgi:hypothetical protein